MSVIFFDAAELAPVGALAAVGLANRSGNNGAPFATAIDFLTEYSRENARSHAERYGEHTEGLTEQAIGRAVAAMLASGQVAMAAAIGTFGLMGYNATPEASPSLANLGAAMLFGVEAIATGFDPRAVARPAPPAPVKSALQGGLEAIFARVDLPSGTTSAGPSAVRAPTPAAKSPAASRPPFLAEVLGPQRVAKVQAHHAAAQAPKPEPAPVERVEHEPDPVWPSFGDPVPQAAAVQASTVVRKTAKRGAGYRASRRASVAPRNTTARYEGWCSCDCGKPIEVGQAIVHTGRGRNAHAACIEVDAAE